MARRAKQQPNLLLANVALHISRFLAVLEGGHGNLTSTLEHESWAGLLLEIHIL